MIVHEQLGIYKIRLKLPFRLNHVNCYGIKGSQGWCFIDAGLNNEETRQAWQQFMADQSITENDVRAIYLTHFHADHIGAAGWLQEITGAPVFMTAEDWNGFNNLGLHKTMLKTEARQDLKEMFKTYGVPADMLEGKGEMGDLAVAMLPVPVASTLEADSMVQLGDYHYRVLSTPGHSDGHICFFNEEFGVLLSGDHLLPKITSNISLWPKAHPDPLNNYLQSLEANLQLPVIMVLPAHGKLFTNFQERIHYLQGHHEERLQLMKALSAGGATVYSICKRVFGEKISPDDLRFAITETAAHLMYLVYRGELELTEPEGVSIFNQKND